MSGVWTKAGVPKLGCMLPVVSGGATKRESMNYKNTLVIHYKLLSCHRISMGKAIRLQVYFHVAL